VFQLEEDDGESSDGEEHFVTEGLA